MMYVTFYNIFFVNQYTDPFAFKREVLLFFQVCSYLS